MPTQKERLQNVGQVVPLAGKKIINTLSLGLVFKKAKKDTIVANVKDPYLKAGLETLANKPAQTALAGAIIANPISAGTLAKSGASSASATFAKQNALTKGAIIVATPAVASAYIESQKVRDTLSPNNVIPASANM